jgi:hypothetical protein
VAVDRQDVENGRALARDQARFSRAAAQKSPFGVCVANFAQSVDDIADKFVFEAVEPHLRGNTGVHHAFVPQPGKVLRHSGLRKST